jgi:hypothetical protein
MCHAAPSGVHGPHWRVWSEQRGQQYVESERCGVKTTPQPGQDRGSWLRRRAAFESSTLVRLARRQDVRYSRWEARTGMQPEQ